MLVKCLYNKISELSEPFLDSEYESNYQFAIDKEQIYTVYTMMVFKGYVWYSLDVSGMYYPSWYPSPLFQILNGSLSRYWIFTGENNEDSLKYLWTFPEWAKDCYFYGSLVEGEEKEALIFNEYKKFMDLEFPNPCSNGIGQILDDYWLMCPYCIDAWESNTKEGIVICPSCKQQLNNPRYEEVKLIY